MYRPITIVSVIMRLFDRLMLPTLLRYMSEKGIPYVIELTICSFMVFHYLVFIMCILALNIVFVV